MKTTLIIVALIIGAYFAFPEWFKGQEVRVGSVPVGQSEQVPAPVTPKGSPTFTWKYRSFQRGEYPYTAIAAVATYPDGTVVTKDVGEVQGDCSVYPEPDRDVYPKSTMIMCYLAGFGDYYKVVVTDGGYAVEHKEFTETSPDYNPPTQPFTTVATF